MTSSGRGGRRTLIILGYSIAASLHPLLVGAWATVRQKGWKNKAIMLSILGNVFFVIALIFAFSEECEHPAEDSSERQHVAPHFVQREQGPLYFCEAAVESELAEIVPHAIYVACNGVITARFEFVDDTLDLLREVTVSDECGRPWVDANLQDGTLIYSRYATDDAADPQLSLLDRDGDGVPDEMVNWDLKTRFKRETELDWRPIGESNGPPRD